MLLTGGVLETALVHPTTYPHSFADYSSGSSMSVMMIEGEVHAFFQLLSISMVVWQQAIGLHTKRSKQYFQAERTRWSCEGRCSEIALTWKETHTLGSRPPSGSKRRGPNALRAAQQDAEEFRIEVSFAPW